MSVPNRTITRLLGWEGGPLIAEKQRRQSSKRPYNVKNCNNFAKSALKMRLFTPKSGINRVEDLAKKVRGHQLTL